MFAIPLMEQLFTAADGILRTSAVVNGGIMGVTNNKDLGDDKWVAKIICGALAGCGGGLWTGSFKYGNDKKSSVNLNTDVKFFLFIFQFIMYPDAFRLSSPQWSFSTPRLLRIASVDMKASLLTAIFYTASTTPALCEWFDLPVLDPIEAQAWSAVVLSSGLIYRTYSARWQQKTLEASEEGKKDQ